MAKKNTRPNLAARKSASKKAEERKLAARKAFWKSNQKQILIIGAIALAVIIVLSLAIDYLYVPSGSVRDFMGNPIGIKENALIREMDGRYYEYGTMDQPAGFQAADYGVSMTSDENETLFYYEAAEEGKAVNSVYVIGVKDRGAQEMLESISATLTYEEQSENKQAVIGGHDVHYFYAKGVQSENEADLQAATITAYVDTIKDSCILVSLNSAEGAKDTLPTEEAMLAEAESIFSALQVAK